MDTYYTLKFAVYRIFYRLKKLIYCLIKDCTYQKLPDFHKQCKIVRETTVRYAINSQTAFQFKSSSFKAW
ncbi:MAG: ribosomal protein L36 [Polaribacter sp.]|jgi:ribosomal protein L36